MRRSLLRTGCSWVPRETAHWGCSSGAAVALVLRRAAFYAHRRAFYQRRRQHGAFVAGV